MGREKEDALSGVEPARWAGREDAPPAEARAGALLRSAPPVPPLDEARIERMRRRISARGPSPRSRARWLTLVALLLGGVAAASVVLTTSRAPERAPERSATKEEEEETPSSPRLAVRSSPPARAPQPSVAPRPGPELSLLVSLPVRLIEKLSGNAPDEEGFAIGNRRGVFCSGHQRLSMDLVVVGVARGDRTLVDEGFRAIDRTFSLQTERGNFGDDSVCVGYWLSHLSHALLLLENSALYTDYAARLSELRPKVRRALDWLKLPAQTTALERHSRHQPGRCFQFANAMAITGSWLQDPSAQDIGRGFAARGLAMQQEDGSFQMKPAHAPAYHGSILWHLSRYALRFPHPDLDEAWRRAGAWFVGRVQPDGLIDLTGNAERFSGSGADSQRYDFRAAGWALAYYGARFDPDAIELAARVLKKRRVVTR